MYTPGYEGRGQGLSAVDVQHIKLKRVVDEAGARFREAGPKLDEARNALLAAVTAAVEAQKAHGNVATYYAQLIREGNERHPEFAKEVPACTEELDAEVMAAAATFVLARKEYDDASFASREANKAFGQHLGQNHR